MQKWLIKHTGRHLSTHSSEPSSEILKYKIGYKIGIYSVLVEKYNVELQVLPNEKFIFDDHKD
jgi:hypothetical protein